MIELKNKLSHGKIIITLAEKIKDIVELNEHGQPTKPLNFPDNSRVVIYSKTEDVLMDGRVRGDKFRPAGRLRPSLGKEFPLKDIV